jgi:putative protease
MKPVRNSEKAATRERKRCVELLSPAGSPEKLRIAVLYGADAVYLSGKDYGLRRRAGNFSIQELKAAVAFAHDRNCKVYVGVNIFARNKDVNAMPRYLEELSATGIDAVIVSDPGVLVLIKEYLPNVEIHISTQANVTNWRAAEFWRSLGAHRVILSRELALEEVAEIAARSSVEVEVFIHGAMCVSYSGRCLLSAYWTGRNANRGECAHPCRWKYTIAPDGENSHALMTEEDETGTYLLSSADLCMIGHLEKLMAAGVAALKIEGRMKSIYYVAGATRLYREAVDASRKEKTGHTVAMENQWREELSHLTTRGYTTGFYFGDTPSEMMEHTDLSSGQPQRFLALVLESHEDGRMKVRAFNRLQVGETVEIMSFVRSRDRLCTISEITNMEGEKIQKAGAGKVVYVRTNVKGNANEILRAVFARATLQSR